MLSDDMAENLRQFYAWAMTRDPLQTGFSHINVIERMRRRSSGAMWLSDDEALWLDRALCRLRDDAPDEYHVIKCVYGTGMGLRQMEKHGHGSRNTNARLLASAHNFIKGFLSAVAS